MWGISDLGFLLERQLTVVPMTDGSSPPKPENRFDKSVPSRLLEQRRLSILSWNPGPRRGREGAIEEHIAGKWHVIALQEAIEYLQHECLTNHFYITVPPENISESIPRARKIEFESCK